MKKTVYIDTTIPSYYVDQREALMLHINRTRVWWDKERHVYDVYCSGFVELELQEVNFPGQDDALQLIKDVSRLAPDEEIEQKLLLH